MATLKVDLDLVVMEDLVAVNLAAVVLVEKEALLLNLYRKSMKILLKQA